MARKRRVFTPEFKSEAVRLVKESGRPLSAIARQLGIQPHLLSEWKSKAAGKEGQAASEVFAGDGNVTGDQEEIRRLRRELEVVRQERDFLKKAAAYFAKESR